MELAVLSKKKISVTSPKIKKEVFYPSSDGKIMGEIELHMLAITELLVTLRTHFQSDSDIYVAGDHLVYYEEGNSKKFIVPDIYIVKGVEKKTRRVYKIWEEKVAPTVVFEIASESTWQKDVTIKRRLYEKIGVAEYYVFDPEYLYLPQPLLAYHLEFGELTKIALRENRIFSPALGLEIVDTKETLRLFNPTTKEFLPTARELSEKVTELTIRASNNEKLEREIEQLRDELKNLRNK